MSNVILNLVEGSEYDHAVDGSSYVMAGLATTLDGGVLPGDPTMLFRALDQAGMPKWYDTHPASNQFKCNRHYVRPLSDSVAKVLVYFVAGPAQPPGSTWVVSDSTSLIDDTTQLHPDTGEPLSITWQDPGDPNLKITDIATMRYMVPLWRLTFEGWIDRNMVPGTTPTGPPNTAKFANLQGYVNENEWNGLPRGFWQCIEFDDQTQDRGVSYTIRATFATKIRRDWSSWEVLRDTHTGKFVKVRQGDVERLAQRQYEYDVIRDNGILKTGLYPLTDFAAVFGKM